MDEAEIKKIIEDAVAKGVRDAMVPLGFDISNPLEMQKDMQHLREWRQSVAAVKRQGIMTAIGILTAGAVGALWMAVKGS